jgi:hypothetical protein
MHESGSPYFISSSPQAPLSLHLNEVTYLKILPVNDFKVWRFMQADGRTNNVRPFVHVHLVCGWLAGWNRGWDAAQFAETFLGEP